MKTHPVLIILLCIIGSTAFAQELQEKKISEKSEGASVVKLTFADSREEAKNAAKEDLLKNQVFVILDGGIAPIVYNTDKEFEASFNVTYYEFGCNGPKIEFIEAYNTIVFNYLYKEFGRKWLRKIRKDVVGFKTWKKKKTN